jgi:L-rhamnose mutarotase
MIRVAFTMRLKPGGLADYARHHAGIWPELVAELERAGIRNMTIFEHDPVLFLYSEVEDEGSWERLWATATHERWGELMAPLMALKDGGSPDSTALTEVFHIEPAGWQPRGGSDPSDG